MSKVVFKTEGVKKTYKVPHGKDVYALSGVDIEVKENEFICVVGPSGCGKTTLLNIIGGLESYDEGTVTVHGQPVIGPGPDRAIIFQQYALYPWMTVKKNIEFPLKFMKKTEKVMKTNKDGSTEEVEIERKYTKEEKDALAKHYIKLVNLEGFEDSFPSGLSGGMKQRVAIARGYMMQSDILLMDEPFGAVDAQTRAQLQEDLLKTWATERKTCFFITHDVEEAALLATRVIVMSARPGRVKTIINVDLPYPRTQKTKLDPAFVEVKNKIWEQVYQEYLEVRK